MKKLLAIVAVLCLTGHLRAQTPVGGPANIAGTLYASNFAGWTISQGNNGPFSWSSSAVCTSATSGGATFKPFVVGSPIKIVDTASPSNSETVTVTTVNISGSGCSINTTTPTHTHFSFYLTSATAGLQEAINYANQNLGIIAPSAVVIATPTWATQLGGTTGTITGAQGNTAVSVLDLRVSCPVAYNWNGSVYVGTNLCGGSGSGGVSEIIPGTNITCSPNVGGNCVGNVTINSTGGGGGGPVVQVNGTPLTTPSPVNFEDSASVTFTNPSEGVIQAEASLGIKMQVVPPVAGQFVVIYPTSSSATQPPTGKGSAIADNNSAVLNFSASISGGSSAALWSGFALPSFVNPANVTAIYPVTVASVPANKIVPSINNPSSSVQCTDGAHSATVFSNGASTFPQVPVPLAQFSVLLAGAVGSGIPSITCTAALVGAGTAFGGSAELDIPAIALVVYYTGTPPPVDSAISIVPPLDYSTATNTLGIDSGQPFPGLNLQAKTVATLPPAPAYMNALYLIKDGTSSTDCTAGGGTTAVECYSNGSSWTAFGGGGGGSITLASVGPGASPSGLYDFSGATNLKVPIHPGYTAPAVGEIGYDSTNGNLHTNYVGTDLIIAGFPSASLPTSGNCAKFIEIGAWWEIADAGAPCGAGGSGSSVGTAGQLQMVGSTAGSFAASGVTDNGTTVSVNKPTSFNDGTGRAGAIQLLQGTAPLTAPANTVQINAPTAVTAYSVVLPGTQGTGALTNNGSGVLTWAAGGSGTSNPTTCTANSATNICVTLSPYNASTAGLTTTTAASVTSGSTSTTVASCSTFLTGNDFLIPGAGSAGASFINTAVSCVGTTLTWTTATSTTVTTVTIQHDESRAIQAAVTALTATGGNIYFPAGTYRVNGPLQNACGQNAVISMPCVPYQNTPAVTITFSGFQWPGLNQFQGSIIQTELTTGNIIGGNFTGSETSPVPFTSVWLGIQNMVLLYPTNPGVVMVNATHIAGFSGDHMLFAPTTAATTPTNSASAALLLPIVGNNDESHVDDSTFVGSYIGLGQISEHSLIGRVLVDTGFNCYTFDLGTPTGFGVGSSTVLNMSAAHCTHAISAGVSQPSYLNILQADFDPTNTVDIYDPSNFLNGFITYKVGSTGSTHTAITVTGAANLSMQSTQWPLDSINHMGAIKSGIVTIDPGGTAAAQFQLNAGGGDQWVVVGAGSASSTPNVYALFDATTTKTPLAVFDHGGSSFISGHAGTVLGWNSDASFAGTALDTGFSRDSAGVIDVGNGTAGNKSGSLNLTNLTVTGTCTGCGGGSGGGIPFVVTTGAVNAMVATFSPAITSLTAGLTIEILPNLANTGNNPTLNVNGLGAKNITVSGTLSSITPGNLSTTIPALLIYNGTSWDLQNPAAQFVAPSGGSAAQPAYSFPQASGYGMFLGSGSVHFSTGGSDAVQIGGSQAFAVLGGGNSVFSGDIFDANLTVGSCLTTNSSGLGPRIISAAGPCATTTNGAIALANTQTTVSCSTSGSVVFSQPAQGTSYKQVMIWANACNGTASYTFPTAFSHTPQVLSQSLAALATTVSTSAVTITGSTSTGFLELDGF